MHSLAFFLSLPSTLLLWSLATFIAALAYYTFSKKGPITLWIPPAIVLVLMVVLVGITLGYFWILFIEAEIKDGQRNSSYLTKIMADAHWLQMMMKLGTESQ